MAEQDLQNNIRNEILTVAAHLNDLERMEAWAELNVLGFEPRSFVMASQPIELARQTDLKRMNQNHS